MASSKRSSVLSDIYNGVRHIVYFAIAMSVIRGLLKLAGPLFMILMFNQVLPSRSVPTLVALFLLLVVILAIMALLDYSRRRILARFGAQFQERVEDHIFSSAARSAYFAGGRGKPAAGLNEVDQLRGFFHSGSLVTILDFFWSPVFLAVVFLIASTVGWVVVAGLALLVLINMLKVSAERARAERYAEAKETIGTLKNTLMTSRHVIESQQMMADYNKRWVLARRSARDTSVELKDLNGWFSILSSHAALLIQYAALAVGAYLTIQGELTTGSMIASMYLSRHVFNPAERFLKQVPNIREAIGNWKSLDVILNSASAPTGTPEHAAALRLRQLTVRCPMTKTQLIRNVSVEIAPGSSIEIVGGSGSGKTVLAETLVGRFTRASGKILFGTVDVDRLSIADAAQTVGYVPQQVEFISGTIEENIAGLDTGLDGGRIIRASRLAQIHDKILSLPDGYLTRIDAGGSIFSKSERHRLAVARALYRNPKLLIVDEPDATFRDALQSELENEFATFLAQGGILLILTRDFLERYRPTRRFTLHDGVLKEVKVDHPSDRKVVRLQEGVEAR